MISDETAPKENISAGEVELQDSLVVPGNEDRELKDRLLREYGGHISSLKQEFSKTKKKANLPREAKQILLHWWNSHSQWPYPTVSLLFLPLCNFTLRLWSDYGILKITFSITKKKIMNVFGIAFQEGYKYL